MLMGTWLFCVPLIMLIGGEWDKRYDPIFERLGPASNLVFLSIGLWVLVLFFTAMMVTKVRRVLPTISDRARIAVEEPASCSACGGGIRFESGELGTVCGFCGLQSLRPQVIWKARRAAMNDARETERSLAKAKEAAETAIDDLIGTPAIMIFLVVLLPLLLASPYLLYLAFLEWPAQTAIGVGGSAATIWIWTRRKKADDPTPPIL